MSSAAVSRRTILKFALSLPGAWEDHPWEETVIKVGKKIFVFLGAPGSTGMGVKLRDSLDGALGVRGASPMAYGLGKWGWVNVPFGAAAPPPAVLKDWVEESYRAIAGKRLVAELDARGAGSRR
jgi:predicted DNA-binding protein (MmcQ/YjbR family)